MCLWSAKGEASGKFPKGVGLNNAISQDGTKMAFLDSGDAKFWLYDFNRKNALLGVFASDTNAESIAMSPAGDRLVMGDSAGILHVWNLKFPKGNEPLAALTEAQRNALLKPAARVSKPDEYGVVELHGHHKTILSTAMLPDGKHFVSSGVDRTIVWSIEGHKIVRRNDYLGTRAANMIFGLKALPNGSHLLAGSGQYRGTHAVQLLDVKTLKPTSKLPGVIDTAWEVAVSPKGLLLAAGGHRHDLVVWDAKTLKEEWRRKTPKNQNGLGVFSVEFSTDGNFVLMGTPDSLLVLDVDNGAVITSRRISQPQVIRRRPTLDQAFIDTGRTVEIVTVPQLQTVMNIPVAGHIDNGAFSQDGTRVAWAGSKGLVVLDIKNKRELLNERRDFKINGLELTPDGKTLITAEGARLRVIPVP